MVKTIVSLAFTLCVLCVNAQGTIKAMCYNLLEFPSADPNNREYILKNILDEYEPDIFMVSELENEWGANLILTSALNDEAENYLMAPFEPSQSGDPDHQQLIFFRKGMFSLESWEVLPTPVRDINYYKLKLSTADEDLDPIFLHVFVTHLKSSEGNANKQLRLQMVQEFINKLETLDPNAFVLFGGDFNFYSYTEPGYQKLLDPNNAIEIIDPINRPGSWHNNINFQDIHSQSTRVSSGPFGAGAGGGLDDRFDFIVISKNMQSDPKLKYIPESYKAFGNNGNCYDKSINNTGCNGEFSQSLRNYLYNMSDHLPIVMTLETNKEIVLNTQHFTKKNALILKSTLVHDKLDIHLNSNASKNISLQVYNVFGQKLMEHFPLDSKYISIDVSQLSNGVYYLTSNLQNSQVFKFLKTS